MPSRRSSVHLSLSTAPTRASAPESSSLSKRGGILPGGENERDSPMRPVSTRGEAAKPRSRQENDRETLSSLLAAWRLGGKTHQSRLVEIPAHRRDTLRFLERQRLQPVRHDVNHVPLPLHLPVGHEHRARRRNEPPFLERPRPQ